MLPRMLGSVFVLSLMCMICNIQPNEAMAQKKGKGSGSISKAERKRLNFTKETFICKLGKSELGDNLFKAIVDHLEKNNVSDAIKALYDAGIKGKFVTTNTNPRIETTEIVILNVRRVDKSIQFDFRSKQTLIQRYLISYAKDYYKMHQENREIKLEQIKKLVEDSKMDAEIKAVRLVGKTVELDYTIQKDNIVRTVSSGETLLEGELTLTLPDGNGENIDITAPIEVEIILDPNI